MKHFFGWIKDRIDPRDFLYLASPEHIEARAKTFDLTPQMPAVYDQGELGSCTANAIGGCVEFLNMITHKEFWTPSRLFIYFNERAMEGTVGRDAGAQIRDGIKTINAKGVCPEVPDWPYDIAKFAVKPPTQAYTDAMLHQTLQYFSVRQDATQIETRISQGFPIVFGILVYISFMTAEKTGIVPMPKTDKRGRITETYEGGHAIMIVGYDSYKQTFICRNSWGPAWGNKGYFTIPYAYVLSNKMAFDFWTVTMME